MSVDPDPLAERQETVSRSELEMDDVESVEEIADVDEEIAEILSQ